MKKLFIAALFLVCFTQAVSAQVVTGRTWEYINLTAVLSPQWAIVAMPGHRYEFSRTESYGAAKGNVFHEFFIGPVYTMPLGNFKLKLPVWYYMMGFPTDSPQSYNMSQNLEIMPIVDYKLNDKITLSNRVIFHNTFYSDAYTDDAQKVGYSLLIREMLTGSYKLTDNLTAMLADEIFIGAIEDNEAKAKATGFSASGFQTNRVYLGVTYNFTPTMSISPQYVYETNYNLENVVTSIQNYLYVTFTYVMKCSK